ncbi:MAG: hypothetical protein ACOC9J_02620 [Persicimonas sp.]
MKRTHIVLVLIAALALVVGCDAQKTAPDEPANAPKAEADEAAPSETETEQADEPSSAAGGGAVEAYHDMDTRKPVPLTPMMANHQLENMRDHLLAVQQIVGAAAKKDFDGVEKAAQRIGSSPQMKQMCNHMGAGAPGFTEQALGFHETADGIIEAAENEDYDGVMVSLEETLNTCTSCHAQYKQEIVTDEVWGQKTDEAAPSQDMQQMHHGGGGH